MFQILAELGVLALALGTTASLNRLFIGWSFLGSLAVPVIGSWLTALVMRRLRMPILAALAVSILLGVVVLTLQFAPGTSMVGLPTGRSIDAVRAALDESFGGFNRLIAPVDATNGFLIGIAAILWLFGFFADTAAFRYSSPVQAVVPYASAFVAIGILARQSGRVGAASFVPHRPRVLRRDPTGAAGDRATLDPIRSGPGSDRGRDRGRRSRAGGARGRVDREPPAPRFHEPRPRPPVPRPTR